MRAWAALFAVAIFSGCSSSRSESVPNPFPTTKSTAPRDNVKVLDAEGKMILRLKADSKGYKVYNGEGVLVARLHAFQDHIKVVDEGKTLFKLKRRGKKFKTWVAEDEQTLVLFNFNQTAENAYELSNGYGDLICDVRPVKGGAEVLDAQGRVTARLRADPATQRVIVEGADGKKKMEMQGSVSIFAASALAIESFDLPRRAALFAFLHQLEAGDIAEGI